MGREAYLARLALGRSAFGPPLRDENGDFVLGPQARAHDDRSYTQHWDERGHPQNVDSTQRAKQFQKAQNEVLEACGVIIRKDAAKRQRRSARELPEEDQLELINEENNIGFLFKCGDRFLGYCLTWWIGSLRRRWLAFGSPSLNAVDTIHREFSARPLGFLFGGFPAWSVAQIARLARQVEVSEPVECMNYLEFHVEQARLPIKERAESWLESFVFLAVEIPLEFLSTLQSLGLPVLPQLWRFTKDAVQRKQLMLPLVLEILISSRWNLAISLYLIHCYLRYEIGWRIFGLLRQVVTRPHRPTRISAQAAEHDDSVDDVSIVGVGRRIGTHTDRRFYGPDNFWSALPIAFPWLSMLFTQRHDKQELKKETLTRCAMIENNEEGFQGHRSVVRARNIISNLESLGVDVEEDFFVDVDQWTRDIDFLDDSISETSFPGEGDETVIYVDGQALIPVPPVSISRPTHGDSESLVPVDIESPSLPPPPPPPIDGDPSPPPTPEVGIRRAISLSQTTPRPTRRLTETNGLYPDQEIEAMLAEARRKKRSRHKKKDNVQSRMTRLTTFAVDSLAWHASSILTSYLLLPLEKRYLQSLAGWYMSRTGAAMGSLPLLANTGLTSTGLLQISPVKWQRVKMIWLSFGIEFLLRGAIWQGMSQLALYYGPRYMWGKF
ncbi:hypothetical protein LTS08_005979 [Lithohypha guttulata]|nr:hypothetical protein LTS08_005979 [Lithohypha guttulata]